MTAFICTAIAARAPFVSYLQAHIPGLVVVWDERRDAMHTWRRGLRAAGDGPSVHIEDDIMLTVDFVAKVERVVMERPNDVIQFFSRSAKDGELGSRYKGGRTFSMNQCYYLPAGYARRLDAFAQTWSRRAEHPTGYDLLMGDWLAREGLRYWVYVPSLVDHRQGVSAIDRRRSSKRFSTTFVDPELGGNP